MPINSISNGEAGNSVRSKLNQVITIINDGLGASTILNGEGAPNNALGNDGDFYLRTTTSDFYGPKTAGSWGSPISLIGDEGPPGDTGPAGATGTAGPTGSVSAAAALTLEEQVSITSTGANEIDLVNVGNTLKARLESDGAELIFAFLELTQAFTKAQRVVPVSLSISSGVVNIDASLSNIYTLSLTANVTSVTISNLSAGTCFDLHITQDGTGGRTITGWNSAFDWAGGTAPTITAAANAKDFISFESGDGTTIKGFWAGDFS
jgi:hypothetical protein